ncbi:tyrosine-type recombinase/integrase [Cerasicoccus frondis]|uniref:tyrosine-type recombinase/integrase n=1 Tax=Cerasicoccus frondis TaxID=490090 RepID=UPI002852A2E4|nr:tyrosine-type recombinase/integrase [Cerasicoccus frondis]
MEIARARKLIKTKALPLNEVWSEFEASGPTGSAGTLKVYRRALQDFLEWVGERYPSITSWEMVSPDVANEFLDHLWGQGLSASTFNDKRGSLLHITKKVGRRFGIENPWLETEPRSGVQQKRLPLFPDQVSALVGLSEERDPEQKCVLYLGLFAGMRMADAVMLRWKDVNLTSRRITYTPIKTARTSGATAQVPILDPLLKAIGELEKSDNYLTPSLVEKYNVRRGNVSDRLVAVIKKAAGEGAQDTVAQHQIKRSLYGFHSLRHTFASESAKADVPVAYLQLMTGDTIQTLQKYYVKVGLQEIAAPGFEALKELVTGRQEGDRSELKRLAEVLSLESVKELIEHARGLGLT